jgi:hypothetical protein
VRFGALLQFEIRPGLNGGAPRATVRSWAIYAPARRYRRRWPVPLHIGADGASPSRAVAVGRRQVTILLLVVRQRQEGLDAVGHRAAHLEHRALDARAADIALGSRAEPPASTTMVSSCSSTPAAISP